MIRSLSIAYSLVFLQKVLASSALSSRDLAPPGWTSYLCLEDNRSNFNKPLLTGAYYADPDAMTIESCLAFCDNQPVSYRFMAITDGFQCSCDNFFENIFESVPSDECQEPCRGDSSEAGGCGGNYMASTYTRDNSNFTIPTMVSSVGQWQALGCYNDSTSARALEAVVDAGDTTVESCVAACQAKGYFLAGLEFGRECFCGSELQYGSTFVGNDDGIQNGHFRPNPDATYCNMGCQGNAGETCGGPALLNVYNFTGTYPVGASVVPSVTLGTWTSQGCYSDTVASRTLERRVDVSNVTVEACIKECFVQSFTIAGLEYAQECWCGNAISSPGAPISQGACNQACVGNSTEVCGGPNALQIYKAN